MHTMNRWSLLLVFVFTSSSAVAASGNCATLKASIESKLKANKVDRYSLDIVLASDNLAATDQIVGSCDQGRRRIVYARSPKTLNKEGSSAQARPEVAPVHRVDARGFIDVWTLRKDVIAVSGTPTGEGECSTARCERDNSRQRKRAEQARAEFNARWRPVLESAMRLGDPVAEVVLRLCETVPLLDRSEVAADCSEKADARAFARQRLEAIGFKPALHKYAMTDHSEDWRQRAETCGQGDAAARTECSFRADIARYERILSVMRGGYLAVAESWNTCQIGGETQELDRLAEECQRLMNLMLATSAAANRFYTAGPIRDGVQGSRSLTLQRPILGGETSTPQIQWPYNERGIVTRIDRRAFGDADFQKKFYAELDEMVRQIEANIEDDLRKEPRWAVFLIERLAGQMYDAMDASNPGRPTAVDIAALDASSPRSQAIRKEREAERLTTVSYADLIDSLHTTRNAKLYYSWGGFPPNLQELDRRPADATALVASYYTEKNDEVFRFNIIMILNRKRAQRFSMEEAKLISQCFVDALSDPSSMVRIEASWLTGMFGDAINDPAVKELIQKGREEAQEFLRYGAK
jgi:hypothetical protein